MRSTLAALIGGSFALGFCWAITAIGIGRYGIESAVIPFLAGCINIPFMVKNFQKVMKGSK